MSKLKKANIIIAVFSLILFLSACSNGKEEINLQEPNLPLQAFNGEFLYKDIPAPMNADVFVFTEGSDEDYEHYSFSFENFTLQEAKEYIVLLENTVIVKRKMYDVYTKNDYPMLNYFGYLKDGSAISLSQCDMSGGIMINIKIN